MAVRARCRRRRVRTDRAIPDRRADFDDRSGARFLFPLAALRGGRGRCAIRLSQRANSGSNLHPGCRLGHHACGTRVDLVVNFNNNTANTGNAASCYCPTGTAQSLVWGNSLACGTACGSQNELTAGGYVLVQASHTFTPLFAADKFLVGNTTMTEYFLVRVD
jgi:hypothetical protein